jgi:hypothetical protein
LLPLATHVVAVGSQHPPPGAHAVPEQHVSPTPPQPPHPAVALHVLVVGSQAPTLQTSPWQHGCPEPPQAVQVVPVLSQTNDLSLSHDFLPAGSMQHGPLDWPQRLH